MSSGVKQKRRSKCYLPQTEASWRLGVKDQSLSALCSNPCSPFHHSDHDLTSVLMIFSTIVSKVQEIKSKRLLLICLFPENDRLVVSKEDSIHNEPHLWWGFSSGRKLVSQNPVLQMSNVTHLLFGSYVHV